MENVKRIGLFTSSPSDVTNEHDSIRVIVDEINKSIGRQNKYFIETLNWFVDTYTQIGEDAQDVINTQIDPKYDVLVAVFWQRLGTPTKREKSGTVEEIERAIKGGKQFLIYFNTQPPESIYDIDADQIVALREYKKSLHDRGVLFKEYHDLDTFESSLRIQLNNLISEKIIQAPDTRLEVPTVKKDPYSSISTLINTIEERPDEPFLEADVFELIEQLSVNLDSATSSMLLMTTAANDLTQKLTKRTEELTRYSHIKDNKLRILKLRVIADLLADELLEYNSRINNELPRLSTNLLPIGPSYSQINQYASMYNVDEASRLRRSVLEFRDSMQLTMENSAGVLEQILKWPPATPKLNKAKRETEIVLKNITKVFFETLKLLDESLEFDPEKNVG